MKFTYSILSLLTALFFVSSLNAQRLSVENATVNYNDEVIPAVKIIMNPAPKEVKEEFKDFMKDRYDVKMKGIGFLSNKDVLSAESVQISPISDKEMDLRAKVVERGSDTEMYVFGKLGYDINLDYNSRYRDEYRAMKSMTVAFLNEFLPDYYQERVDETQDKLDDLQDNRNDLKEDIADNEKKISELEKEIKEMNSELSETESSISETEQKLRDRRSSLQTVNQELRRAGDE